MYPRSQGFRHGNTNQVTMQQTMHTARAHIPNNILYCFSEYGSSTITAGLKSFVNIFLDIENAVEDAFQASLSFVLPTNLLELVNVFNQTRNGEVS